ncbi:MAG: hypothetical protein AAF571_10180 [Verrucomicrobiota bacterium]
MSTVEEIESAIEQLPAEKVNEVANWLDSYVNRIKQQSDPILSLGESPVTCGVDDASEKHDSYLSGK